MLPEDLAGLRKLYLGFIASRVVLTANNLGVFDSLKKPATAEAIAKKLGIDNRGASILLDALTGIGLAAKSRDRKYRNTTVSRRYLVRGAPLYQGDIVRHASSMWENFSGLDEVVRTGKSARRGRDHEAFIRGMHNLTLLRTKGLLKAIGLKGVHTMLDLGGGPGTNAMAMAKQGVNATIFDLPATIAIARKVARQEGVSGLRFIEGDFHVDDIGSGYDLILISQIFHAYSPGENMDLLSKCRKALNPGGRVVVQEFPINDALTAPPHSALFSVNMLAGTKSGRCYSPREMKNWLIKTGFGSIRVRNLEETVIVEGRAKAG
ncbi:MAG: methyltransferase domain-containing protein [Nitrospirae bacterium]|nr:MAG: methyltransferase domain-containing protein [Nitrospirota bacterium]